MEIGTLATLAILRENRQCCLVANFCALCHVLCASEQGGPRRSPGAIRGPGQPQGTPGQNYGAPTGSQIYDYSENRIYRVVLKHSC